MKAMSKKKRRSFTEEQKAEAVKIVKTSGKTVTQVAHEMGLTVSALRKWVKQDEINQNPTPRGPLTTDERAELARLRKELKRVEMERDFLKKRQPSSPGRRDHLRGDRGGGGPLSRQHDVRGPRGLT